MKDLIYFSNPSHGFCYHYERLSPAEQSIYRKLAEGVFQFKPAIVFRGVSHSTVQDIYQKMKLDLPAAFFDEGLQLIWNPLLRQVKAEPQYRFSRQEAEDIMAEIMDRVQPILNQCRGRSQLEQETIIHDWFCQNVNYDNNYAQKMGGSSFEMVAPLLWGRGVCSGISKAAKFLFDQLGIKSLIMLGRTSGQGGTGGEEHCWLMVKIRQPGQNAPQRLHLDITFDMTTHSKRYFNMTDQEALADRILT